MPRDQDPHFDAKLDERLLWRGSNTGMFHASSTRWENSHRDFLVRYANDLDGTIDVLTPVGREDERVGTPKKLKKSKINPAFFDIAFSNKPIACSTNICPILEELYPWRPYMGQKDAGTYRYVLDVRKIRPSSNVSANFFHRSMVMVGLAVLSVLLLPIL